MGTGNGEPPVRGRKHIDGRPAGEGERLAAVTVTLSAADIAHLRYIGGGNASAGVRYLVKEHRRLMADIRQATTPKI